MIVLFVGLICLIGIVAAPYIVSLIAPGFLPDSEKFSMTVLLTRIMFPFLLCISLATLTIRRPQHERDVLHSRLRAGSAQCRHHRQHIHPVFLVHGSHHSRRDRRYGRGGPVPHTDPAFSERVQFISNGEAYQEQAEKIPANDAEPFLHPGVRRIGMLVPSTAGLAVAQINIFISTILASYLPEGASLTFTTP
ncbi:MAG: hypothetical protein MZV70_02735 [Desulfobacterales bacterium]|nr:hypothetical protein [Desulfobacterales bacterium]